MTTADDRHDYIEAVLRNLGDKIPTWELDDGLAVAKFPEFAVRITYEFIEDGGGPGVLRALRASRRQ